MKAIFLKALLFVAGTIASLLLAATVWSGAVSAQTTSRSTGKVKVPKIVGKKLPLAEYLIRDAGLRIGKEDCDCTFGIIIKSDWYVCIQKPLAGTLVARGTRVSTYSDRSPSDC